MNRATTIVCLALCTLASSAFAGPLDRAAAERGREIADNAAAYLLSVQDDATGGWSHNPSGPNLPAISGLVLKALLDHGGVTRDDPRVVRGVDYVLNYQQQDGGIYDNLLPSYNTAISISMLARIGTPEAREAMLAARGFLLGLQHHEGSLIAGPAASTVEQVGPDHPYYGGIGYGRNSRPDMSNLHFFLAALEDSGFSADEPAVQRALTFLARCQMEDTVNDMPYADGSKQGGFIYSTSPNRDGLGIGESKAGEIEETMDDGTNVSRLRAYGSVTYIGFKSYAYAQLSKDDPRVIAARRWIGEHYTLEENPGAGTDGLYYFFMTFGRALDAWGEQQLELADGSERDWAADLIDRLGELQNEDGSFRSVDTRWMEDNPVLITAYSLIALNEALD
ncbi:MAG: prenyltransferase/squalene oxidase repeat-containing protein [Planctomycetota bacterium]